MPAIKNIAAENIKVYPSISNGIVYVEMPAGYEAAQISLLSLQGQNMKLQDGQSGLKRTIQLGNMPAAAYMLQVLNKGSVRSFRIVYEP